MNRLESKQSLLRSLILAPARWDEKTEKELACVPLDRPVSLAANLRAAVESGAARLVNFERDGVRLASAVISQDLEELVILACWAIGGAPCLTPEIIDTLSSHARLNGLQTLRFSTTRPGLVIKAESSGFHLSEVVMRKRL